MHRYVCCIVFSFIALCLYYGIHCIFTVVAIAPKANKQWYFKCGKQETSNEKRNGAFNRWINLDTLQIDADIEKHRHRKGHWWKVEGWNIATWAQNHKLKYPEYGDPCWLELAIECSIVYGDQSESD